MDEAIKGKNTNGSRFVVLNEEEIDEEGNKIQRARDIGTKYTTRVTNGPKPRGKTKGKRPTVKINEKQVMGEERSVGVKPNEMGESIKEREERRRTTAEKGPNKAAEVLEHMVVIASEHGACITRKIVRNNGYVLIEDHHNEPPSHEENCMEEDTFVESGWLADDPPSPEEIAVGV